MENSAVGQVSRENEAYDPAYSSPGGRPAERLVTVYPGMGPDLAALSPAARALLDRMVTALAPAYDGAINRAELAHLLGKARLTPGDLKLLGSLRARGFIVEADRVLSGGGRLYEYSIKRVVIPPAPLPPETIEERLASMRAALRPSRVTGDPVRAPVRAAVRGPVPAARVVHAGAPARRWRGMTALQISVLAALAALLVVALLVLLVRF